MNDLIFSSVCIDDDNYKDYTYNSESKYLHKLSQINIFIGRNNSGKSRFIRKLFSDDDMKFLSGILDTDYINDLLQNFIIEFNRLKKNNITSLTEIDHHLDKLSSLEIKYLRRHNDFQIILKEFSGMIKWFSDFTPYPDTIEEIAKKLVIETHNKLYNILPKDNNVTFYNYDNIYIPTLRGLRPIQNNSTSDSFNNNHDNYFFRTQSDYFQGKENYKEKIYTGLSLYQDLQKYSHGDSVQREQLKNFEKFLSKSFFHDEDVELIPAYKRDFVIVKIGNFEEPIFNLGDGIQSLIILTYPLYFNQQKTLKVYIEEPEVHLHPGYQRKFIETLLSPDFKNFQYFITTHSNHFLDITLDKNDISIYTFEKLIVDSNNSKFLITNVSDTDTNILSLIGVRNSSVFLSNCTIWVEGITDRIYLRKYLEIIQRDKPEKFMEDTHFSFVEYSGNNITHWSFLDSDDNNYSNILVDKLCGKLFLITDRDNADFNTNRNIYGKIPKKESRHKQLKHKLGDRFYCLRCREIENLLMPNVLVSVINKYNKKNINNSNPLKYEDYKSEYLGKFINERFKGQLQKNYATDSGSIINKVDFAKKAMQFIDSKENMSKEATEITEKLYEFIKIHNQF